MSGLDHFNSDDFDVEVPEFSLSDPLLREVRRICPDDKVIGAAGLAAYWGNHSGAERLRGQAGYAGVSDHEFPS